MAHASLLNLGALRSSLQSSRLQATGCQTNTCYLTEMSHNSQDEPQDQLVALLIGQSVHFPRNLGTLVAAVKKRNR